MKIYKPTSPGRRGMTGHDFSNLSKKGPEKSLTEKQNSTGGRNSYGRITSRFRGGGHKQRYRVVDFRRHKTGVPAVVFALEYDPNRSARLALLHYADGDKAYIIAPEKIEVGQRIISAASADIKPGNSLPMRQIPTGTSIHNVEIQIGGGGKLARSAGVGAELMAKEGDWVQIRLPSGEVRMVHADCRATVGDVGNSEHINVQIGKAGRTRWAGKRPHQRGVTMNPVDHPMGGGEGRSSGGRHPCSPWGQPTKGYKTRTNKTTDKFIIRRRGEKG